MVDFKGQLPPSVFLGLNGLHEIFSLSLLDFRANLGLVRELGDRAAEGRAYGNLGNTHYLLGNFDKAAHFHEQVIYRIELMNRLKLGNDLGVRGD